MPGRKPLFWQSNDWKREATATEGAVRAEGRTAPGASSLRLNGLGIGLSDRATEAC